MNIATAQIPELYLQNLRLFGTILSVLAQIMRLIDSNLRRRPLNQAKKAQKTPEMHKTLRQRNNLMFSQQ